MAVYLNQIFYKSNKFDNPQLLSSLYQYALTTEFITNLKKTENSEKSQIQIPSEEEKTNNEPAIEPLKSTIYYPELKNSLFWSMYIAKYSMSEFLHNTKPKNMIELEEKQKIIDDIKQNPQKLKLNSNHKLTNVMVQEIISDVMTLSKVSLLSVFGYAFFYGKNFFIVNGKTYYSFLHDKDSELENGNTHIIYFNESTGLFGLETKLDIIDTISEIKRNLVCLESVEKPMKGLSAYKVSELEDYARKLELTSEVHLNKKELYDKIQEKCIWNMDGPIIRKKPMTKK